MMSSRASTTRRGAGGGGSVGDGHHGAVIFVPLLCLLQFRIQFPAIFVPLSFPPITPLGKRDLDGRTKENTKPSVCCSSVCLLSWSNRTFIGVQSCYRLSYLQLK